MTETRIWTKIDQLIKLKEIFMVHKQGKIFLFYPIKLILVTRVTNNIKPLLAYSKNYDPFIEFTKRVTKNLILAHQEASYQIKVTRQYASFFFKYNYKVFVWWEEKSLLEMKQVWAQRKGVKSVWGLFRVVQLGPYMKNNIKST